MGLAFIFTGRSMSLNGSVGNESGKTIIADEGDERFFGEEHETKKNDALTMKKKSDFMVSEK